jgi:hypothetical protein
MNSSNENPSPGRAGSGAAAASAEETLRLIAHLPAPEGLPERVQAGLRAHALSVPRRDRGRVLAWPAGLRPGSEWMRSAAAAAIAFIVVGGGWGVYSRVQPQQPARAIAMPPRMAAPGGFSGANAMRTPNTLHGPLLARPGNAAPAAHSAPAVTVRPAQTKASGRTALKQNHRGSHASADPAHPVAAAAN